MPNTDFLGKLGANIWDGLEGAGMRAATGYWPDEIAQAGQAAGAKDPFFRGDTGYHQFAAYEMAKRLGPDLASFIGNIKEQVNLDPHGNWKGHSPIERSADSLKDVRNNQTAIEMAARGEENPVLSAAGQKTRPTFMRAPSSPNIPEGLLEMLRSAIMGQ